MKSIEEINKRINEVAAARSLENDNALLMLSWAKSVTEEQIKKVRDEYASGTQNILTKNTVETLSWVLSDSAPEKSEVEKKQETLDNIIKIIKTQNSKEDAADTKQEIVIKKSNSTSKKRSTKIETEPQDVKKKAKTVKNVSKETSTKVKASKSKSTKKNSQNLKN